MGNLSTPDSVQKLQTALHAEAKAEIELPPQKERTMADNAAIRPFHFGAPQADLVDLRNRIKATKWPEREQVTDASQGVQLATTQKLAQYWVNSYDGASARQRSTPCRTSSPRSMGSTFISFTFVQSMTMRCR